MDPNSAVVKRVHMHLQHKREVMQRGQAACTGETWTFKEGEGAGNTQNVAWSVHEMSVCVRVW